MTKKRIGMEAKAYNEQKQRFQKLFEYTILSNTIDEADNDQPAPDQQQGAQLPMPQGPEPQGPAAPPQMGGAPMDGPQPHQMGGNMEQHPPMDAAPAMPNGLNPQGDITQDDFEAPDQPSPEDNVVDITDLTDKQEETQQEIGEFNELFTQVLDKIENFENLIKGNDEKIEQLKDEFEKRNPSQLEKLSMHTAKGEPFNVDPSNYWKEKEETTNYSTESDDNGKGMEQYTITANDIASGNDWRSIARTLSADDDDDIIMNQSLDKLLRM